MHGRYPLEDDPTLPARIARGEGFSAGTTGMLMEYPYTDTENVIIFLSTGAIYAQNSTTGASGPASRGR